MRQRWALCERQDSRGKAIDFAHERTCSHGVVLSHVGSYLAQIFKRLARPAELHVRDPVRLSARTWQKRR